MIQKHTMDSENFISNILELGLCDIKKIFNIEGIGSSRYVFSINKELVLKYAYRKAGITQSEVEFKVYNNCNDQCKKLLCPIIELKDKILIMKKAVPLNKALQHWGIRDSVDGNILMYLDSVSTRIYCNTSEIKKGIRELSSIHSLLYEDLIRIGNWGILDGNLVLIDYGCDRNLYVKYYLK